MSREWTEEEKFYFVALQLLGTKPRASSTLDKGSVTGYTPRKKLLFHG
jgi:hypothetical protein